MIRKFLAKVNLLPSKPKYFVPNPADSDIYLVSYPKSGNTWMRYLLAYSIWPDVSEIDLVQMADFIPSCGIQHDVEKMLDANSPCNQLKHRIIKQHFNYSTEAAKRYAKRVIYIVRDGRDAIVSYWHYCNQRDGTNISFSKFIEASSKHGYGPWNKHVMGWLHAPIKGKIIIRYEDMLNDTEACLRRTLEFAEISVCDEAIENAVRHASFNSLKRIEQYKGFNLEELKSIEFIRKGKSGSWQDTFGPGDIKRFNEYHGGPIPELGYIW